MRVYALVAVVLSLGSLACRGDTYDDVDTTTTTFDTGVGIVAGGDTALSPPKSESTAAAPSTPVTTDGKALGAFIAASRHEISHGVLATQKGSSQAVKDLGRSISRDHDDFVQRAIELGKRLGIASTPASADTVIAGHPSAMGALRSRTGVEFDRAFLEHEADYHRWLIETVNKTMLPNATNEELRTFLQQALPAFEAHMKGAQDLLAKLG
jgi:putative membrane protein